MVLGFFGSILIDGIVSIALFFILLNFANNLMANAFKHTDAMINNFQDSDKLNEGISDTDSYMKYLKYISGNEIGKILESIDISGKNTH
jgi:hypothetical protein